MTLQGWRAGPSPPLTAHQARGALGLPEQAQDWHPYLQEAVSALFSGQPQVSSTQRSGLAGSVSQTEMLPLALTLHVQAPHQQMS